MLAVPQVHFQRCLQSLLVAEPLYWSCRVLSLVKSKVHIKSHYWEQRWKDRRQKTGPFRMWGQKILIDDGCSGETAEDDSVVRLPLNEQYSENPCAMMSHSCVFV